jgi:RNA polymerase sigma factor (sigma-70 family)
VNDATTEALFLRYRETGDAQALALVFDRLAPELLLVAAHLAGGDLAEDLVQATFLDAIRHRARWDRSLRLAPWLLGLLGNHVREARRQRKRVPDRERFEERSSERPEAAAEANECLAAVHAAVERLPRHYRQVLSLRLVHGFDLQQIANSLGVPLGTVKVRMHRGLALVRRALPAGLAMTVAVLLSPGRGLAAVRQAVLGNAAVPAAAAGVVVGTGVLAILGGIVMKQGLAAVVAVVVLVAGWFALRSVMAEPGSQTGAPEPAAVVAVVPPAVPSTQVDEVAPPAASANGALGNEAPVVREAAATTGGIEVQVVWASDEAPAAGVLVRPYAGRQVLASKLSGDDGRVTFDGLAPGSYQILPSQGSATGRARCEVVVGQVGSCRLAVDGDVRLRFAVVDAAGAAQSGATIWNEDRERGWAPEYHWCVGTTDAEGIVRYRGLPLGNVWARKAGHQPGLLCATLPNGGKDVPTEEVEVRLTLGAVGTVVSGVVVDPRSQPVPGARVIVACVDVVEQSGRHVALCLRTDDAGRFACDEVPVGERSIVASAPGFAPIVQRVTTAVAEPTVLTLMLQRGAVLSGQVTDSEGHALPAVKVHTGPSRYVPGIYVPWGGQDTTTDGEGRYQIDAVWPGEIHAVAFVEPTVERQFVLADGEHKEWNVQKLPELCIRGLVTDDEDKPLPAWRVEVREATTKSDQKTMMGGGITATEGRGEHMGKFMVTGLENEPYRVMVFAPRVSASDWIAAAGMVPRAVLENVRPSADELHIRISRDAMASGWLEGSIAMPAGVQAKAELSLYAKVLRGGVFGVPQERLGAGQTTFRIGPLPAGEYDLLCDIEGRGRLQQKGLVLAANATLQLPPFAADAQRPVLLALQHADGRPAVGGEVKLAGDLTPCRETAPGLYESWPILPGAVELVARGPEFAPCRFPLEHGGNDKPIVHTVPNATAVQFVLQPATPRDRWIGALSVRVRDASGADVVRDLIQIDGKNEFVWPLGLPPGTYSFAAMEIGAGRASTTFTVTNQPLRVDLQLAR